MGCVYFDAAGSGVCVEVEVSGVADGELDRTGARGELPVGGGLSVDLHVAATGARTEGT